MADDQRHHGPGHLGEPGATPAAKEAVVLPEHASAYFSPRSAPRTSAHQTIETEAVRLDPAIDPDNAVTQPLKVDGLQPPPWLGDRLLSNAPTVLIPIVKERRRRKKVVVIAAAVGALAGIIYGVSRSPGPAGAPPEPVLVPPTDDPEQRAPAAATPGTAPPPERPAATVEPARKVSANDFTQLATRSVPSSRSQARPRRPAAAPSAAPSAWLKAEPPKAWVK